MRALINRFRAWLVGTGSALADDHVHVLALRNAAVRAWEVLDEDVFVLIAFDERECLVRHIDRELAVETRGDGAYSAALGALVSWNGTIVTGPGNAVLGVTRRRPAGETS